MRNLDVTTLRSFVAVADAGGVTRAAGFLNLTQSAVSMQLKRLEDVLGVDLMDRSGRTIALTASGEQLLSYARRMVALNDEVMSRLTDHAFEGAITLGVPHDIVYPAIPQVLKQFNALYPRVKVQLETSHTRVLKNQFGKGEVDLILTTETSPDSGAETVAVKDLRWVGAPDGVIARARPLRLAFGRLCVFRTVVTEQLDRAGIPWEMGVETDSDRTIEAAVAADLALHAMIDGTEPPFLAQLPTGGDLPALPRQQINMYGATRSVGEVHDALADLLRTAFASGAKRANPVAQRKISAKGN